MTALAAAVTHVGKVRSDNQDSGYAGQSMFFVADGMGGHAGGDVASALAARRISASDGSFDSVESARDTLVDAIRDASDELQTSIKEHPELSGMGTTISGIVRVGSKVAIAHIGDSRIYRYRVGALTQMTSDHTFVQRLVDMGRITKEEAETHPRRNVIMRVLGNVDTNPEIDTAIEETHEGDRWLLCSDGLSSYVPEDEITSVLGLGRDASQTAQRLLQLALTHGAPDNVTIVVVDVDTTDSSATEPTLVGSAAKPISYEAVEQERKPISIGALLRHPISSFQQPIEHFEPESDEYLEEVIAEGRRRTVRRRVVWSLAAILAIAAVALGSALFYNWTQSLYYVGVTSDNTVAIYQGVQQSIGPISLSHVVEDTGIEVDDLAWYYQQAIQQTIPADSLESAQQIVERLEPLP